VKLRWARSATRHRVNRQRSAYVIQHAGLRFRLPAEGDQRDDRLLFVGDDEDGLEIEVMAVELEDDELFVIHAMPMRAKYRDEYEEAKIWRN